MPCRTAGVLRIIGGAWRGRKINFIPHPSLRPSGDRVRETLFNCLGQQMTGKYCLDLFAGSGVLGLEAGSRGATAVTFVEKNRQSAELIRQTTVVLKAPQLRVITTTAEKFIATNKEKFDIIFLDPPFSEYCFTDAWLKLFKAVEHLTAANGRIYAESGTEIPQPSGWRVDHERTHGAVHWRIFSRLAT